MADSPTRETPTVVMEPPQLNGSPPASSPRSRRRQLPWILAGVALIAAMAAIATIVALNGGSNKRAPSVSPASVYHAMLTATLTPIVSGNENLSKALQAIDGSKSTIRVAMDAAQNAQSVTVAARGAVAVLSVPLSQQTLSQQAAQALTQEAGYVNAVVATLNDPNNKVAGSIQSLASGVNSAFVPLSNVAAGGPASVFGVDNFLSWVGGATRPKPTPPVVITPSPPVTTTVPITTPDPGGSLTACDQNISANGNTICGLAENVFVAYWNSGNTVDGWGNTTVTAQSPVDNGFYTFDCSTDGSTVNCSATGRTGNPLFVTFPMEAVRVY